MSAEPLLSDCQLASMRSAVERTFTQSVEILEQSTDVDETGGHSEIWTVISTIKGRLVPVRQKEPEVGYAQRGVNDWAVKVPYGTSLQNVNRVRVSGSEYSVRGTDEGRADALFLTAQLLRVEI